jgi:hypothetical protein
MAKIIKTYAPITGGIHHEHNHNMPVLINEYIDKFGTGLHGPYICVVNDKAISRVHWDSMILHEDDIAIFIAFPQGGEGGSSPIKVIAMISIMALAGATGMWVAGLPMMMAGGATTFGGYCAASLVSGTIMFGGSALVNAVFPPTSPEDTEIAKQRAGSSISSYNINDRGNTSSLDQVIPVQYGRMKHYPSYAMQNWSQYENNLQYAYLLFCHGQGEYDFESYAFGTVDTSELSDVSIGIFANNATVTIGTGGYFYDNVFTSDQIQNIEVKRVGDYSVTSPGTTQVSSVASGDTAQLGTFNFLVGGGSEAVNGFKGTYSKFNFFTTADAFTIYSGGSETNYEVTAVYLGDDGFLYLNFAQTVSTVTLPIGTGIWRIYKNLTALVIITTSGTVPFSNGIHGPIEYYDGFVAGDEINIQDNFSAHSYNDDHLITSVTYFDFNGAEHVGYGLSGTMPADYLAFANASIVTFKPGDTAEGYVVPENDSSIQRVDIDIALPNGLYSINQTTGKIEDAKVEFQIQYKNYISSVWDSSWTSLPSASTYYEIEESTKSAIYKTMEVTGISTSATKVKVRINRKFADTEDFADDMANVNSFYWVGLKAFLPDTLNYGNVTMISCKVKVSNSLVSTSLSEFNATATRKLPTWNGSVWSSVTATRNPAWAIADACRNTEYSLGIDDDELDLAALLTFSSTWSGRGDYCDGLFDAKESFWDAITKITRVGRAQPLMIAGSISFIRDEPKTIPKQVFTTENIQSQSFMVDYIAFEEDTPDSVTLKYFDNEEWVWKEVTEPFESGGSTDTPAEIQRWGVTTEAQAIRDAKWEAACNAYRRSLPQFICELEGRILNRLDYISVSNPRVGYGISGHVTNVDGNVLTLSEEVEFESGDYYIAFREKDGTQDGPYIVTEVTDEPNQVTMAETPPTHIYTGYEYEKTYFQFGSGTTYDKKCLVVTVEPQGLETVKVTCMVDDSSVYTADGTTGL